MSNTPIGGRRGGATKTGVSLATYAELRGLGMAWCSWCASWRPRELFSPTPRRGVGAVHCYCNGCRSERRLVKGKRAA